MFISSSLQADEINRLFTYFMILSIVILAIVGFMVIGGAILYRSGKRKGEPSQKSGNKPIEMLWTIVPLVIVTVFFFLSFYGMKKINEPIAHGQKADIIIVAHQWWWEMRYPKQKVVTANELHIPVGKNLMMRIESADVIHSWWVPALGRKIDAIPGRINYGWIEADSAGLYEGACSEYCGMQHAWMRISVIAESTSKFDVWITQQQQPAVEPTDSLSKRGEHIFQRYTCGSCHSIAGTSADASIGPDLTHFASRQTMLSGLMGNNRQNLRKWLEDPQAVKHGAYMPDFLLDENEVNALVKYLEQLK